jgi:hypothetical protein
MFQILGKYMKSTLLRNVGKLLADIKDHVPEAVLQTVPLLKNLISDELTSGGALYFLSYPLNPHMKHIILYKF